MPLTGNQRRFLRALGHHLNPVVQIGHQGPTEQVLKALKQALNDHELVKVKFNQTVDDRSEALEALVEGTGAEFVQALGRTALLYLKHPKKPVIQLPKPRRPAPAAKPPQAGEQAEADEDLDEEDGSDEVDESEEDES